MKLYLKVIAYVFCIIFIATFLLTILHYTNIVGINFVNISKLIITIASMIIGGFMLGKRAQQKGWFEGIKLSIAIIILLLIMSLIWNVKLGISSMLYYLIIVVTATCGSMLGISRNEKNKAT